MDSPTRQRQCDAFARLDAIMEIGTAVPSERAAAGSLRWQSRTGLQGCDRAPGPRRSDCEAKSLAKVAVSARARNLSSGWLPASAAQGQARHRRQVRRARLKGHTRQISLQYLPLHLRHARESIRLRLGSRCSFANSFPGNTISNRDLRIGRPVHRVLSGNDGKAVQMSPTILPDVLL
jgi:hypothetical protein